MTIARHADTVLGELSSAGVPWLAIDMAGTAGAAWSTGSAGFAGGGGAGPLAGSPGDATILDLADPHAVPVTVNPLEPAPGYPIQAHTDRVAGLLEAAFGLPAPVAAAIRAGLRRTYTACGWDMVTGSAAPGAVAPPVVPPYRQFRSAVMAAAEDLGYGQGRQADVRGFLLARLDALWAGPAGRFLEGGHPVDAASLLRANTLVTNSGVADDEAASFLAGVLLVRLAEQLCRPRRRDDPGRGQAGTVPSRPRRGSHARTQVRPGRDGAGSGGIVVIGSIQGAAWFSRLLADIRAGGADITVVRPAQGPGPIQRQERAPASEGFGRVNGLDRADGTTPVLLGRRSAACGGRCRRRPCDGYELHVTGLLARDDGQAWLRLWVQTLVLAFLTGRPVPRVPRPLRPGWPQLSPRRRDCLLATLVDAAVTARAAALRPSYDPRRLTSVIAVTAAGMLTAAGRGEVPLSAGGAVPRPPAPPRAGQVWVIPPLRWLHEIDRVTPLGQGGVRPDDIAPPLDFGLSGLPDWPGIRVRDRLSGLRRHPLSMESERNREQATTALLGDDGGVGLNRDLAIAGAGLSPRQRLRHAAQVMGVGARGPEPGWLEVVLAWPEEIIRPDGNSDVRRTATG